MSKKVNKTLIGAFVIGAIGLLVIAVLVLGSGKFFAPTSMYVLFFEGSVKGLNIGSPVMYHGVKMGEVKEIQMGFNPKDLSAVVPVYIEIDPGKFILPEEFEDRKLRKYEFAKPLIEKGFKAQLQTQSFVTGQLMINLDFYPDKPIKMVGMDKKYPEIPTIPTTMEELTKTIADLPLKEIVTMLEPLLGVSDRHWDADLRAKRNARSGWIAGRAREHTGPVLSSSRSSGDPSGKFRAIVFSCVVR